MIFLVALFSIVLSVAAQASLKAGMSHDAVQLAMQGGASLEVLAAVFQRPQIGLGLLLYGSSAMVWLYVLANWDVSKAYPLVGMGFVLTLLVGYLMGETVSLQRMAGVVLIAAGVALVSRS